MESCFQLLSLFYLTVGRNNEAPAAYALTSTIKRLLDHLTESDLYSAKDLESISSTLTKLATLLNEPADGEDSEKQHWPYLVEMVKNRVELCQATTAKLQQRLERFGECLLSKHERIISILRSISLANTKSKVGLTWLKYVALVIFP
jgi:hypothetical protein